MTPTERRRARARLSVLIARCDAIEIAAMNEAARADLAGDTELVAEMDRMRDTAAKASVIHRDAYHALHADDDAEAAEGALRVAGEPC